MTYFHITLGSSLDSIFVQGLIPQIGKRSKELGESEAIFLFPDEESMETALYNWLGEWYYDNYGEDIELALLKIDVPTNFPIENGEVEYEKISRIPIPPKYIMEVKKSR